MVDGIVTWFTDRKGFGFVEQECGPDLFLRHFVINATGYISFNDGDNAFFDIEQRHAGPSAVNVAVI